MTRAVFYLAPQDLAGLGAGSAWLLDGPEGHHARTVKRIGPGEELDLADGQGLRAPAVVRGLPEGGGLELELLEDPSRSGASRMRLVQALAKNDRDLLAAEMATELGVAAVVPWQADRSIVRWKGERAAKAHAKWEKTVAAAAKQARRATVPVVEPLAGSRDLPGRLHEDPAASILVLHEEAAAPLTEAVAQLPAEGPVYVVVGPEGGISEQEVRALEAVGARTVSAGPDVLRASTAGAAALAVLNAGTGYWS